MASLPFLHVALIKKDVALQRLSCDPAGIRTQDPIIKSDVLYQLSYRVVVFRNNLLFIGLLSYF
jgi:vancomycin permeability regulator SanA